jgi:hypothetical protein
VQRYRAEAPARRLANLILVAVVLLQLIVLGTLAFGIWITWYLIELDPLTGCYIGAVFLVMIVLVEVVAISLARRKTWAWTAAVVVFTLALPSIAGLVGLLLLFRPGVREEFTARRRESNQSRSSEAPSGRVSEQGPTAG